MRSTTFRIFLSSTFGDFQSEREALRAAVWPRLERYCVARGASFEVVDLRWGVSEADSLSHDTLRICLDEVAHCQKLSPKPNFLMLIGDRYGWRPLPTEIPAEEFDTILATLAGDRESRDLLNRWYRRDDNALPPHYRLLPRDASQPVSWADAEGKLITLLRNVAHALGLTRERRERYYLSATHLEIVQGTLAVVDAAEHVFAFFRDIHGLEAAGTAAARFTDLAGAHPNPEVARLRAELRNEIASAISAEHCFDYACRWTGQPDAPISTDHLTTFCADIERSLQELIDRELQTVKGDALDRETAQHTAFAEEKIATFMGRAAEIEQVLTWADEVLSIDDGAHGDEEEVDEQAAPTGAPPLIVHGPGGVGKSAFMARVAADIAERRPDAIVICRFIGATPRSIELYAFLSSLLREIARRYGQPETLPEGNLKVLIDELPGRLAWASAVRPLVLALDALDQFNAGFDACHHHWMPRQLPPHVAVLFSVLDGDVKDAATQRYPEAPTLRIPIFSREDGGRLLDAMLRAGEDIAPQRQRRLTDVQRQAVLDAFARDGRPLYLVLAASIVRRWTSWHEAEALPGSIEALVADIIRRLHATHGECTADRALNYLTASRFGVSDEEIRDLLWQDPEARAEFDRRKNKDQPEVSALPPVIWSRIYFELAPYLTAQGIDGALLHRFFHRVIGEEVARVSLADNKALVHSRIADYFARQPLYLGDAANRSPNRRKLMEEPWQRIQAGQIDKAEALLTDLDFAMAKCEANRFDDLLQDFQRLAQSLRQSGSKISRNLAIWEEFIRTKAHILRRGDDAWPSHKILLQLTMEHADDSPLTQAAMEFIRQGRCHWAWLKCTRRPEHYVPNLCLMILEGHRGPVTGVEVLGDGCLVSWSGTEWSHEPGDGTLRVWNGVDGTLLAVMEGHANGLSGVERLTNGHFLSWSPDGTLQMWDVAKGICVATIVGHDRPINGILKWSDGRLLSWSDDGVLRMYTASPGIVNAVMMGHTGPIHGVQLLADGRLLSWSSDGTLRLWDGTTGAALAVLKGHSGSVDGTEVLADGRLLSWSSDGTLRLWDGTTGAALAVLEGHTDSVDGTEVLADGRLLSWSHDGTLRLWDGTTGSALAVLDHVEPIMGARVLSDGRILAWSEDPAILKIWDSTTGTPLAAMSGHKFPIKGVEVLPDGRVLSWSWDGTLRIWDDKTGVCNLLLAGHVRPVDGFCNLEGGRLLSWSYDGELRIWDGATGESLAVLEGHGAEIKGVQLLVDWLVVSWSTDGTIRFWDGKTRTASTKTEVSKLGPRGVHALADESLVSMSWDGTLVRWDRLTGAVLSVMVGHTSGVSCSWKEILTTDGILSWSDDGTLRLWDYRTGRSIAVMKGHTDLVREGRVLADGRLLSWSNDGTLRLWESMTGKVLAKMVGHTGYVGGVTILSDGRLLSWSPDSTLRLWDGTTGAALAVLEGHTDSVDGTEVLADGRLLSWSHDGTLRLWDGTTGSALAVLEGHADSVDGTEVLADGRLLSWSRDGTLRLWDGTTGAALAVLEGHTDSVDGTEVLADGRLLSWSHDGTLRLWDSTTGAALAVLKGHAGWVEGVEVLADRRLLSWSRDGTLRIWDGMTGVALAVLEGHTHWIDGVNVLPDGRFLSWSGNEAQLWTELGCLEGRLSTAGIDVFSSFDDLVTMAAKLTGKASTETTAWCRVDRLAWASKENHFPDILQWHTDTGNLQAVHSISSHRCIIQTTRDLQVIERVN